MAIMINEKVCFFHIPKTGGMWVEAALTNAGVPWRFAKVGEFDDPRHAYPEQVLENFEKSFTFTRDEEPWRRSWWRYVQQSNQEELKATINQYPSHPMRGMVDIALGTYRAFVESLPEDMPSKMFETYTKGVTFAGQTENIQSQLVEILEKWCGVLVDVEKIANTPRVNQSRVEIELGGGRYGRPGFLNCDNGDGADWFVNLDNAPWPIETNSVDEVYSSHCLEHLSDPVQTLREITRISRVGSLVTIRVPDSQSEGMFTSQHKSCVSENFMRNILEHFRHDNFPVEGKSLVIESVVKNPCPIWFPRARASDRFRDWTDEEIMTWIPRTCHENEFTLRVVEWK